MIGVLTDVLAVASVPFVVLAVAAVVLAQSGPRKDRNGRGK